MPNDYINQIQVGTSTYDIQDNIARNIIDSITTSLSTMAYVGDAPSDDNEYTRKNGQWTTSVAQYLYNMNANKFSLTTNYSTNDYVIYNNNFYKFTTAHAANNWNLEDAITTNIGNELSEIKNGYLPLTGGTLTGHLNLNNVRIYAKATGIDEDSAPSSAKNYAPYEWYDKDGNLIAHVELSQTVNNELRMNFGVRRYINSEWTWKNFFYQVAADGTLSYGFGSPSAVRNAIGASSGIFPASVGGTGASKASANRVFAGPSSGSDAAPTFRKLDAADIPELNASKITTGTLPINRGGTGATTADDAIANLGAVAKSGDTMTGPLTVQRNNGVPTYVSKLADYGYLANLPTDGSKWFDSQNVQDKNGKRISLIRNTVTAEGKVQTQIGALRNNSDDTTTWNTVTLGIDAAKNLSVSFNSSAAWRKGLGLGQSDGSLPLTIAQGGTNATTADNAIANLGGVKKSGDTMTDSLTIETTSDKGFYVKNTNITLGSAPSSARWLGGFAIKDKDGKNTGYYETYIDASGNVYGNLVARNRYNNANSDNYLRLYSNVNGSKSVSVSHPDAWRTALGFSLTRGSDSPSAVKVSHNTNTTISEIDLTTAGLYILYCSANFSSNANGNRRYVFLFDSSDTNLGGATQTQVSPVAGSSTIIGFTGIVNISSSTTYHLRAYQDSGGDLNVTARVIWLKIL